MPIALLLPRFSHPALEERYASMQSELLLRRACGEDAMVLRYDTEEQAASIAASLDGGADALVIIDPLLLATSSTVERLSAALRTTGAPAAVPVTNAPSKPDLQAALPEGYLTVRQFEAMATRLAQSGIAARVEAWTDADPGMYLTTAAFLRSVAAPLRTALNGSEVAVTPDAYTHRWAPMRGQHRIDMLERIPETARKILDVGCAEGLLGAALKKRQDCEVIGIEIEPNAAEAARGRLDRVYSGDVRHVMETIDRDFDFVVAGDVLEHLEDPWSFLINLKSVTTPDATLLLSVPNAANWSVLSDLLHGRFDYTYHGIVCAGHLRFFTKQTMADTLAIAGWSIERSEPQPELLTEEFHELLRRLERAGLPHSRDELATPGYYIHARRVLSPGS